ncbi:hypothetical protein GH714_009486 [Hevea brasiliensis]|uniref:HAUS augmin-like complex subunit 6 N-terminal domain-containing protein n=1 Tax=Hevea brasiliensis TaxID=3981 RepID=A0A6A6LZS4_HEVBR|nr:hypothetical protein GH714_009486 [Hevea brasiliensis]
MYTNCLLLGLDPNIIGLGASNGSPRVGLFRHSNPKLGEQLLYFILSSLRGPFNQPNTSVCSFRCVANAAISQDFDKVWPIFDSAQSRDFRKVVQGIISELESQGALPRSNSRFHRLLLAVDQAFQHAATLLPVTKARIALERRRFLQNAETAVQRQAMWSNLAHEMTAEFRGLCAEEEQSEVGRGMWDDLVSSSSQNAHLVSKATRLWESILARKSQHEVLASGPIEDLIAHREHRYRISGSSCFRLWIRAKANDGEGPDLLRSAHDGGTSGHAESLAATLAEHQQHLASFQVLINQLKEVAPAIQKSIAECTEKVNNISSSLPPMPKHRGRATSPTQAQSSGRTLESSSDDVAEVTSKMFAVHLDKVSASPPALKLPQLFSLTPNSSGKDSDNSYVQNLKRSVREAALSTRQSLNSESSRDSHTDEISEHFFLPLSATRFSSLDLENKVASRRSERLLTSQKETALLENHAPGGQVGNYNDIPDILNDLDSITDYNHVNGFLSAAGSNGAISGGHRPFYDIEESHDQVFSPPLLMDTSY